MAFNKQGGDRQGGGGTGPGPAARILIMEDEFIVAMDLSGMAENLGFAVSGPYATLAEGLSAVRRSSPDAAILDVQLADGEVFPLADELVRLGVPIIFHSGHADGRLLHDRYPGARSASKPCPSDLIAGFLREATAAPHRTGTAERH